MVDVSLENASENRGVNENLVRLCRQAINDAWIGWDVPTEYQDIAHDYCRSVKIAVSGGFSPEKIQRFEENAVPVDIYAVGSGLLKNDSETNNDFTMDVSRVLVNGAWANIHKVGRGRCENQTLYPVAKNFDFLNF
jgi:nicotinate phosphoribosyltransferase